MRQRDRHRVATLAVAGYAALQWLGRTAGTTKAERRAAYPGDDTVDRPIILTTHAITINAPTAAIWPWLVQMGWHRAGWYTARWVDRLLFPANRGSVNDIVPALQHLKLGDFIPDGPPETGAGFVVAALEPDHYLVLHSGTHIPPGWRERFGAWVDWTWTFVLQPLGTDTTRFLFRCRGRAGPWWLAAGYWLVVIPADFIMARQMMRGIKARVERAHSAPRRRPSTEPRSPTARASRAHRDAAAAR